MANGDKKDGTVLVRLHDDHWEKIKPDIDALKMSGRKYPSVVMACMIEGAFTFQRNPQDIVRFRNLWNPTEFETTRKDFRATSQFCLWAKSVIDKFRCDLNSFIIASIHRNLGFFRDNPEMIDIVYREWVENQLSNCMSAPRQMCLSESMSPDSKPRLKASL